MCLGKGVCAFLIGKIKMTTKMCSNCVVLLEDLRQVGKGVEDQLKTMNQKNPKSGAHCLRCGVCKKVVGVDNNGSFYVQEYEEHMNNLEINPCPECGEPCRLVQIRCDKMVVCCTYPRLDFVDDNKLAVRILYGCGYTSPMERHPVDCIERHNKRYKEP